MSTVRIGAVVVVALAAALFAPRAFSHITLEAREAPVGSRYKAVLRVPHGCKGSATTRVRVRIPEGVFSVKPQPKAGWSLETVVGEYARSYALHGAQVGSGVKEIAWTGGPLLDEHYDEFVFVGYLSGELKPGSMLHFPTVQECEEGVERWIDIPSPGQPKQSGGHSGAPAPGLKLLPGR